MNSGMAPPISPIPTTSPHAALGSGFAAAARTEVWMAVPSPTSRLSGREIEVLRLLTRGLTDREIGDALSISPRTASYHVTNLLTKLDLESRTAAAAFAIRQGLD